MGGALPFTRARMQLFSGSPYPPATAHLRVLLKLKGPVPIWLLRISGAPPGARSRCRTPSLLPGNWRAACTYLPTTVICLVSNGTVVSHSTVISLSARQTLSTRFACCSNGCLVFGVRRPRCRLLRSASRSCLNLPPTCASWARPIFYMRMVMHYSHMATAGFKPPELPRHQDFFGCRTVVQTRPNLFMRAVYLSRPDSRKLRW